MTKILGKVKRVHDTEYLWVDTIVKVEDSVFSRDNMEDFSSKNNLPNNIIVPSVEDGGVYLNRYDSDGDLSYLHLVDRYGDVQDNLLHEWGMLMPDKLFSKILLSANSEQQAGLRESVVLESEYTGDTY